MELPIVITTKQLDHVLSHDKILYNTNNHYIDEQIDQPKDYREVGSKGQTKNWVDKFHTNYHKITIDEKETKWMRKALDIGMMTGRCSHIYDDELDNICKRYEHLFPQEGKWFVRTERVSLKEGKHGPGPYTDFRSIIESAVTGRPGHTVLDHDETEITFYLFPWIEIEPDKEFRIFVYNNNITAISAQHLYSINGWLVSLTDDQIKDVVYMILKYFEDNIKKNMEYMGSYSMDLVLIGPNDTPYFIEPNSFGKYYPAGSALYSWVYDHDTLHDHDYVEIRYCDEY